MFVYNKRKMASKLGWLTKPVKLVKNRNRHARFLIDEFRIISNMQTKLLIKRIKSHTQLHKLTSDEGIELRINYMPSILQLYA